jgi:aldehyde:ferredoxin oxidoreductase
MQPILTIDLTSGKISEFHIPEDWERDYLGGASLGARFLYESLSHGLDPLSPQAPLLWINGPLSGTFGPSVGRYVVCAKSPATGLWGESNCGGFWGPELRMAGYFGLLITGKASQPVYLWIHDKEVEIRPAEHLWGLDTYTTQNVVQAEIGTGKPRIAVIGQAGEAQIPFALILTDHGRVAGRTGMGAVMGSKNLKAVAVEGSGSVPVLDPGRYTILRSEANRLLRADSQTKVLRELGSAGAADYFDYLGEMPKKYFQSDTFFEEIKVSGSNVAETILAGVSTCHACVIACGRVVKLSDGIKRKGPEYETMVGFGPNLCLNDPVLATEFGELCDRYGMDTISLSNVIGLAFLLYEKGIITDRDTAGLVLDWGNADAVRELIHQTVKREKFGALISQGALALGRHYNSEEEAVQVNGLEVAYHDPRGASGMALVYATSPRGACHNQSDYFLVDLGQVESSIGLKYYDRQGNEEKAANVAIHQNWRSVFNSLVLCIFANVPPETILELVNTVCGYRWEMEDLLRCGERSWNLKRIINHRLGLRRTNDNLPKALLMPHTNENIGTRGYKLDFDTMIDAYYHARGWDTCTGIPTIDTLARLNLSWVVGDLRSF